MELWKLEIGWRIDCQQSAPYNTKSCRGCKCHLGFGWLYFFRGKCHLPSTRWKWPKWANTEFQVLIDLIDLIREFLSVTGNIILQQVIIAIFFKLSCLLFKSKRLYGTRACKLHYANAKCSLQVLPGTSWDHSSSLQAGVQSRCRSLYQQFSHV